MKTLRTICLILLIITLSACQQEQPNNPDTPIQNEDPIINEPVKNPIREQLKQSEDYFAIAFLGYYQQGYSELKEYLSSINADSFIQDIAKEQYIETDGDELYCIITKNETAEITVHEWLMDEQEEFTFKKGKELYHSTDGKPILVKGNLGDFFPNLLITIQDGNQKLEYNPSIDLMTGKVGQPFQGPTLYDFTQYDKVIPVQPFDTETLLNTEAWEVSFVTTNNQLLKARFIFDDKGFMTMAYSLDNHAYTVHYQGMYGYPDPDMYSCDTLFFNLQKTEDYSNENCPEHIYTILSFGQRPFDMFVYASYVDGDRLFVKDETNDYVFGY